MSSVFSANREELVKLLAAMFALGLVGPAAADTMFRVDARHSGVYEAPGVPVFHHIKWTFRTGGAIVSPRWPPAPASMQAPERDPPP